MTEIPKPKFEIGQDVMIDGVSHSIKDVKMRFLHDGATLILYKATPCEISKATHAYCIAKEEDVNEVE